MDHYNEQLVEKMRTGVDTLKIVGIVLGSVVLAAGFMFLSMLGLSFFVVFAVGILILGIWLLSNTGIEYEYIVTNNEMDIDKIIGRRKRKRMITVDLSKAEEFSQYPSDHDINADAVVHATSGLEKDAHFLVLEHKDYGKVKIIFNPNEKIREAITQELPRALRAKLNNNVK